MRSFVPFLVVLTLAFSTAPRSVAVEDTPLEPHVRDDGAAIFQVAGAFRSTPSAAKESALQAAQQRMRWWLEQQEPPIRHAPSIEAIRKLILQEEAPTIESVRGERMYKMTITVSLNPNSVRELRGADRVVQSSWWLGGAIAVLALIALVVRLDEWTKGYLTRWLVIGAAGLAVAVGLLWWWAK